MSTEKPLEPLRTSIWLEEPEPDNAFAAASAHCHGYDVYGEMLGRARWVEMLYLLLRGDVPARAQADALESLAVALANAGPRDAAVHAAMSSGVGGSPAAASLMAALAVGAGQYGGAREVFLAMEGWSSCGTSAAAWRDRQDALVAAPIGVWPACEHVPGFDPNTTRASLPVAQTLHHLAGFGCGTALPWLVEHLDAMQTLAGCGLAMTGVAAAALHDLGFTADEGEMMFLMLRLPGAAAHAIEQRRKGHRQFPFFSLELINGPNGAKDHG